MYELIIGDDAMSFLEKLPNETAKRIFKKIQETKENPHRYFIRLVGSKGYKLRVGDYRIIADIEDNELKILILHIDHRKNAYKRI
tara:strand:+ start:569 stop:823 length:255 start_codon:yes stop_codon:yes gene_type:complete